jgi:hypothetical protein
MILVFAGNNSEANEVRKAFRLMPGRWAYISSLDKLHKLRHLLGDTPDVYYYGSFRKRPDYEEIEAALFHLNAQVRFLTSTFLQRLLQEQLQAHWPRKAAIDDDARGNR